MHISSFSNQQHEPVNPPSPGGSGLRHTGHSGRRRYPVRPGFSPYIRTKHSQGGYRVQSPEFDEQESQLTPEGRGCLLSVLWTGAVAVVGSYLLTSTHRWDPVQVQFCGTWLVVWASGLTLALLLSRRSNSKGR